MSEILLTWLNTEVDLSKKITDMENDFSNGYLLGELLNKFNQTTSLDEFSEGNDRKSKMKNFILLQLIFKKIGIKFDMNTANEIMESKKGVILKLLYQIRSKLEKKGVNQDILSMKRANHLEELYSSMKFKNEIPQYEKFTQNHFNMVLQAKTKSQKQINLEKHLSKFSEFKKTQDQIGEHLKEMQEINHKLDVDERIKQMKSEEERFRSFASQFEQKGLDDWKANILKRKEIQKKDLEFQLKEAEKYKNKIENSIKESEFDLHNKIETFERNLQSRDSYSESFETNVTDSISEISNKLRDSIYQKIMNDQSAKTERNRRRRKIIVEQSKAQLEIENRRSEEQYIGKLYKRSNQEKQLQYETFRVSQIKNVIIENRKLRDEMYRERRSTDLNFQIKNEDLFLIHHFDIFKSDLEKEEKRRKDLNIALKQKDREINREKCERMVDLIIDIAEEAYAYQQTNDMEEIDSRVWREWNQIFINNLSLLDREDLDPNEKEHDLVVANTQNTFKNNEELERTSTENMLSNMMSNYNSKYGNTFYSGLNTEAKDSVIDRTLNECEFIDYIHFLGQWNQEIIPESAFIQLNLAELMAEPIIDDKNKNKKGVLTKEKKTEEIFKEEDVENLIIPRESVKNTFLGDLLDILVEIKYPEDDNLQQDYLFHYIPLKLALIGHDFAGKKTMAKLLSQNFPLKIYTIEDLLNSAFDILNRFNSYENNDENSLDSMKIEKKIQLEKYSKIKDLAGDIQHLLQNGSAISDDIYVDLFIEFINIDFPKKDEEEILEEIFNRVKEKEEIQEDIEKNNEDKLKRPNTFNKVESELTQKLMRLSLQSSRGFIIVNFPNTYNQAKLLEKKLSSFIPEYEMKRKTGTLLKENFSLILDRSNRIIPKTKLIKGGLDYVFLVEVSPQECSRRALGRRIVQKESGEVYHLDDNLPHSDSNLCERMVKIEDTINNTSSLVSRCLSFDNNTPSLIEFYSSFGIEKYNLKTLQILNGNKNRESLLNDFIFHLNNLFDINEVREIEIVRDEDKTVSIINKTENLTHYNNSQKESKIILNEVPESSNQEEEDEITIYNKKIENIKKLLNKDLCEILLKIWHRLFENYLKDCKSVFKFIRLQRDAIGINFNLISQKFIQFLKRPSKKQILLLDFQSNYNKFMDEYPDLIDDPQVKEEHHQSVDDLNDRIYEIIESRKIEAVDERRKIMTSGWIENEMEKLYLNLERLFQAEVDKFIGSLILIRDYYHNLDNKPLGESPFASVDILKEEMDPTPLELESDPSIFPKIEKLYKTALKVQFQYDEAVLNLEKKKLEQIESAKKIKDNAKTGHKKNVSSEVPIEFIEKGKYEDEMKCALKNEKSKFRHRITLLKHWGIKALRNQRSIANTIYNKLDDWIILSIKAENDALVGLTNILKSIIENEEKIKYELELDTFDVIMNMDVQNFIELPPSLKPSKEVINKHRFSINALNIIIDELKTYLINGELIRTSTFIEIFIKKYISSKNENDVLYGLPLSLRKLSFHNYYKFIKYLDPQCSDFVNIKYVVTYFCLLNSKVLNEADEHKLRKDWEKFVNLFEDERVSKDIFIKLPMWFDDEESTESLKDHETFDRPMKLKEILFDINKDDEEFINLVDFIKIVNLRGISLDNERNKSKTYYEILFN